MERGRGGSDMDAQLQPAPVGIGRIDATGTLTALNAEFARMFDLRVPEALDRPAQKLPSALSECWREIIGSPGDSPGPSRWTVTVGQPPDHRLLNVVGWATPEGEDVPVVQLVVSEIGSDQLQSLDDLADRARLAREIHDGLAQDLWLAKLTASKLARHPSLDSDARVLAEDLLRSIDSGLAEAQTAVLAMRPQGGPVTTLSKLVERQVEEFSDRFGIRVDCHAQAGPTVPPRVSIEVLRVLQEALNNVRKHANARRVIVTLGSQRDAIRLSVRDDGTGFDPATLARGYGRQSMHERAQSIGAKLTIASAPGRGTTVTLRVPADQLVTHR
jgi:anti-sigma regulatory factor (Ser/Thr protein kinase)